MPTTLAMIKQDFESRIGSQIRVIVRAGRKRTTERNGILKETYPAIFVVDLDQEENAFERVTFSYTDVLTNSVEVEFQEEEIAQ